jgi:hypothetical protein
MLVRFLFAVFDVVALIKVLGLEQQKGMDVDAVWIAKGKVAVWEANVCGNRHVCLNAMAFRRVW